MVIEALPFVLLGVFISGLIQIFVTEKMLAKYMPKNRFLAILMATLMGVLFPACECGIVPIVRRLVAKGLPIHVGISFMLTAPIINPVVLFATYVAFGSDWKMVFYRSTVAIIVACCTGLLLSFLFKGNQLKDCNINIDHFHGLSLRMKLGETLRHAVDEFFSVGKYLLFGAFVAASMQTYVKTSTLLEIGHNQYTSSLVMMGLAFILSLCSEADAFIASSFQSTFSVGSLIAFLVLGPMLDVKNTLMLLGAFRIRLVLALICTVSFLVFISSLLV